ncbi:lanC-like protein GCL1 [Ananas comosus]|uniref:LanC-like protein GCL1 n=1 Tax=Ananas comosus TaxID=4615 RepID=A0A6P5F2Y8_ANACO|nr:lanC-like protein GCL1 [Ananas comosus]
MSSTTVVVSSPQHEEEDATLPAEFFLKAAVLLKNQVVEATWRDGGARCDDPTAYAGLLGTALMCLRSYEATGSLDDLRLCAEIVDACAVAAQSWNRDVTFLCGRAGVYALGAAVANYRKEFERCELFLDLFLKVAGEKALSVGPEEGGFGMSYELLHGRAGFLFAVLFINKHLGPGTVPDELTDPIVEAVLAGGRTGASDTMQCPLMYRWQGTCFWGAAHGLSGILHVLLHFKLNGQDRKDVEETIQYMIRNRFEHSKNYPSSEGNARDKLVQWSHGAGGVAIMLCKAAQVLSGEKVSSDIYLKNKEYQDAAVDAGEVVWKRGLNDSYGLADGIAGNAYAFLSLYRLTKENIYFERAATFSSILYQNTLKLKVYDDKDYGENKYSLFQGFAGVACLWFDMMSPESARFPGFEL